MKKGLQKAFENALTRIAENPCIGTAKVGGLRHRASYLRLRQFAIHRQLRQVAFSIDEAVNFHHIFKNHIK